MRCFFNFFTCKCASRHNGVHFFDISTSKSGPTLRCFVPFDFEMCFAPQRRALFRHLNFQKWSYAEVFCTFWLRNVLRASTACTFFDISTSKSAPNLVCFLHFDLETCFALQRRALFRHRNCQKWSGPGVFCAFWLRNVLRTTLECNFSSLIWPDGCAPTALASLLFDPPEPQIIGKNAVFRDFPTFRAPASSFFWLSLLWSSSSSFLSSPLLSSPLLSSPLLSSPLLSSPLLFSSLLFSSLLFSSLLFFSGSSLLWLFPSLLFICTHCRKFDF